MNKILRILSIILFISFTSPVYAFIAPQAADPILRFYPNPATSFVNFDFQKSFDRGYSIQVYNAILGKKMYEANNINERTTLNLTDFNRGIYIYQLYDRTGKMIESGKFQVNK